AGPGVARGIHFRQGHRASAQDDASQLLRVRRNEHVPDRRILRPSLIAGASNMQSGDNETGAVWDALWTSLDGSRYDVQSMKTTARENSHFVDDLSLDSLDLLEFYLRLDEEFNVSLSE